MTESLMPLINDRIAQLRAHPDVHVINATIAPPDTGALTSALAELEAAGLVMDAGMRRFYEECDGVLIQWAHRDTWRFDTLVTMREEGVHAPGRWPHEPGGTIYVVPVREFASAQYARGWAELDDLADELDDLAGGFLEDARADARTVAMSMRVFSHRWEDQGEGLFQVGDRHILAWSEEQCAEWEGYPDISFTQYMRFVLGCFGYHALTPWQRFSVEPWAEGVMPEGWDVVRALEDVLAGSS